MNEHVRWAVSRWETEVKNRPLQNIHRRSLDTTWRQVIRHFGGDDVGLCGLPHDELLTLNESLPQPASSATASPHP
jgi:hypothetical protein